MVYIVTWIITNVIGVNGPVKFTTDEYGRRKPVNYQYSIKYWEQSRIEMTKEFTERDSAISFYISGFNKVDAMYIDSMHVFTSK